MFSAKAGISKEAEFQLYIRRNSFTILSIRLKEFEPFTIMNDTRIKEYNFEKGKTVEVYNAADQLLELNDYDTEGNVTTKVVYQYDDRGNNIVRLVAGGNGKHMRRLEFEYDGENKLKKQKEFDAEEKLVLSRTFERDRSDKKISVKTYDPNGALIEEKLEDSM